MQERDQHVVDPRAIVVNTAAVGVLWVATRILQDHRPVEYTYLILEDGWIEYGSFVAWLLAAAIFLWTGLMAKPGRRAVPIGLSILTFVLAMEEISWLQRVIGWRGPEILTSHNLQGETNLHNLILLNRSYWPLAAVVAFGAVVPWLLKRRWRGSRRFMAAVPLIVLPVFLAMTLVTVVVFPEPGDRTYERSLHRLGRQRLVDGWYSQAAAVFDYLALHPKTYLEDTDWYLGMSLLASGRTDEGRGALQQFLEDAGIDSTRPVDASLELAGAKKILRLGLALCGTDRGQEAAILFERSESAIRQHLLRAGSLRAETRTRGQLAENLLARRQNEPAARELEEALRVLGPRKAAEMRRQFHEMEVLVSVAGCP